MFKRVLLSSSVLFGLFYFAMAGECFAENYYAGGDPAKADQLYQNVISMWPENEIWPQMRVAKTNIALGKMKDSGVISKSEADDKIKAAYKRLLEKYPNRPAAGAARRWLSRHAGTK